jgi:hypothetical protein
MNKGLGDGMWLVGVVSAIFWAVGTNLINQRWYIVHGVSVGDVLFIAWLTLAMLRPSTRRMIGSGLMASREHLALMSIFALLLLASVAVNAFRFGGDTSDVFAILRFFYFSAIIAFCIAFVPRYGLATLVFPFAIGVALLGGGRLYLALTTGSKVLFGLPLLKDPNVIGNMFGIGVLMCSLLILQGWSKWPLVLVTLFSVGSMLTFSKGAWLMVLIGLGACVAAFVMRNPPTPRGLRRSIVSAGALLVVISGLAYVEAERLNRLISFKLTSSSDLGTTSYRYRFAKAGALAMGDYPVFGLGLRNYAVVEELYPDVMPEPSENAHNVFAQIGAVAGVPALVVFMVLFVYPFVQLWRVVSLRSRNLAGLTYVVLVGAVFFASGAVQLQIMAQPFFWFFTGVTRGWYLRDVNQLRAS